MPIDEPLWEPTVYLDAYLGLVVLSERRAGRLPAYEGIRLVKERRPEGTTDSQD